jgi:hypothetical protein
MKNNTSNINYQEEETNIREILLLLWDSKKIIIATTLIFVLASFTYSQIKAPVFVSYAKVTIGSYLDTDFISGKESLTQIQSLLDIQSEINFIFDKSITPIGKKFLSVKTSANSFEEAEKATLEILEYIENRSKVLIELKLLQDQSSLFIIEKNILSTENELDRLLSLKNVPNTDSRKDVYLSQVFGKLDGLLIDKGVLENKLAKTNLFEYSKVFGEISTQQEKTKNSRLVIFGSVLGLALSVVIVFIRRAFHEK